MSIPRRPCPDSPPLACPCNRRNPYAVRELNIVDIIGHVDGAIVGRYFWGIYGLFRAGHGAGNRGKYGPLGGENGVLGAIVPLFGFSVSFGFPACFCWVPGVFGNGWWLKIGSLCRSAGVAGTFRNRRRVRHDGSVDRVWPIGWPVGVGGSSKSSSSQGRRPAFSRNEAATRVRTDCI